MRSIGSSTHVLCSAVIDAPCGSENPMKIQLLAVPYVQVTVSVENSYTLTSNPST